MTTNLEVQAYALDTGWLNAGMTNNTGTAIGGSLTTNCMQSWPNSTWTHGYYYYPIHDHRPIKLGMSEVEKLRSAAKRDAKLKKILEKFTDQIEVVVDFK